MTYNASIARLLPLPARIAALPVSPQGWPIPYFVNKAPLDFRVIDPEAYKACMTRNRCWVCGGPLGRTFAFLAGPMCGATRTSSEPPSHRECAEWSAMACPFLTQPKMRRNDRGLPEERHVAGFGLARNPGVSVVWVTRSYKRFRAQDRGAGGGNGTLIEMGEPEALVWFAEGRAATRAEVAESVRTGLPLLQPSVDADPRPIEAAAELAKRVAWLTARFPAEVAA